MKTNSSDRRKQIPALQADLRIALIYAAFGGLWILFSDALPVMCVIAAGFSVAMRKSVGAAILDHHEPNR